MWLGLVMGEEVAVVGGEDGEGGGIGGCSTQLVQDLLRSAEPSARQSSGRFSMPACMAFVKYAFASAIVSRFVRLEE